MDQYPHEESALVMVGQMPKRVLLWPVLAGLLGLLLTGLAVLWDREQAYKADELKFAGLTDRVKSEIIRRVGVYRYGLMGTRSVFAASDFVERKEFRALVRSRNLPEEFPGAVGLGFVRRVPRAEKDQFLERTRKDEAPNFVLKSEGNMGSYYVVEYLEPIEVNFSAMGYDLAQDPQRREVAERAMETGEASLSEHVTLVQNDQEGPGFLFLLPVYKNNAPVNTPEERRTNLEGWVYMPLLSSRIFKGAGDVADREIDFEVFDGEEADSRNLVYDDDAHLAKFDGSPSQASYVGRLFRKVTWVEIGGRKWTLVLTTTPKFRAIPSSGAWGIGLGGALLSGGIMVVLLTLGTTTHRAKLLAQGMTRDMHRLALVAENTTNAVVITDAVGHIDWVNNGFMKVTGYSLEQVQGQLFASFLNSDVADKQAIESLTKAISNGEECRLELVCRAQLGREYVVDIEVQPVRNETLTIIGFVVVETDITAQITHRNQLASIFRAMAEGLVVQSVDGSTINCNPEAERILGLTREQILSRTSASAAWNVVDEQGAPWPPEKLPTVVTLKTGEAVRGATLGLRQPDGSIRWISVNTQAIRSADGRVEAAVATFSDITRQIKATADLDIKERMLRTMIDQSRQFAGMLTLDGTVVDVNRTALTFAGVKNKADVVGKPFWKGPWWKHSEQLQEWLKGAIARAARGETVRSQTTHPDVNGAIHFVDFTITPVMSADGKVIMLIPEGWDVTESKLAADALGQARDAADTATKSKSEFLANMSHEIRTPMTAILGYTDLLAEEWDHGLTPRQRLEYIATIKRNGEHLLSIINDILDLSKIETGKMTVERIDTYPDQIIHDVMSLMYVKAQAKGLKLEAQNITALPERIQSDPLRLRQILVNLVGNAIKFTEVGGVTIRVMMDKTTTGTPILKFEVRDTGIGLTQEQVSRLFGAFEQADASTTRRFGGTGLGLRISKRLAEMLAGDITVSSTPGNGSTFTLSLATGPLDGVPMIEQGQTSQVVRESIATAARPDEGTLLLGVRILMAEDGPDNQRLVAHHLRKAGATVTIVENGELAVRAFSKDGTVDGRLNPKPEFDLVLMDMQMPIMDGYTATRLLRTKGSTVPIIALTAHAMAGDADKCLDAGCDDYTAKPIDRAKLIGICAAWIGRDRSFTSQDSGVTRTEASSTMRTASAADVAKAEAAKAAAAAKDQAAKEQAAREQTARELATKITAAKAEAARAEAAKIEAEKAKAEKAKEAAKPSEVLISTMIDDEGLVELIGDFVARLPERAQEVRQHLAKGQYEELARLAHQLAGSAGSYGYPTITDTARTVETMLRKGQTDLEMLNPACEGLIRLCLMAHAGFDAKGA